MSDKKRVLVLGAGGVIGQHMMITVPDWADPLFVRWHSWSLGASCQIDAAWMETFASDTGKTFVNGHKPDVIVNLAGESRPDVVERDPERYEWINTRLPYELARWCDDNGAHLIHISSQAVFQGDRAPYAPHSYQGEAVNAYGRQKQFAEKGVATCDNWTILRPTFVLGVRPFPGIGRKNPVEHILGGKETTSVEDRRFSILFATMAAAAIWMECQDPHKGRVFHLASPSIKTRLEIARDLGASPEPVNHDSLPGLAARPLDTTYDVDHLGFYPPYAVAIEGLKLAFSDRSSDSLLYRSKEIAAFLGRSWIDCARELDRGFLELHNEVTADFRRANPQTEEDLLRWYMTTEAYIWELTAYHCDPGFNYNGMCAGIIGKLKTEGKRHVLCLGDGIGTLTIRMQEAGLDAEYHDLYGSRTAAFAQARFTMRFKHDIACLWTHDFKATPATFVSPGNFDLYDAVVSLDFLEHVPNVEQWVRAIFAALKPGALLCAQNAFGVGSGPDGPIPMHLACNDRFERDWDPLLRDIGFVQESSNWYRKPL